MNKTKISKIILLVITIMLAVALTSTKVYAEGGLDLNAVDSAQGENTETGDEDVDSFDDDFENTDTNTDAGTTDEGAQTDNEQKEETKSSTYPENEIPYAGPGTTILMAVAFIACGITGIYTFVKLSDYSNI